MKIYTSYFAKLNKILDAGYLPISIARRVWEVFEQISEINGKKTSCCFVLRRVESSATETFFPL